MNCIRVSGLGIVALTLFAIVPMQSEACRCAPPPEPAKALAQSAAVFVGKVVAIEDGPEANRNKTVTLEVEKWWKGGETARVKVVTNSDSAACGFGFQLDSRYLVYATAGNGAAALHVNSCSRTRAAQTAEGTGDFKDLGEGKPPVAKK